MKLYENVAIGNFLYGLGFAVGKRVKGDCFPSVVNLLQQTPDDTILGDLFVRAPGQMRIFEFKQHNNYDSKELDRHKKLKERLEGEPNLSTVSRLVHWFIETASKNETLSSRILPYLDAFPRDKNRNHYDFATFIEETAESIVSNKTPIADKQMTDYLSFLISLHKTGTVGSGGLIVKMSANGSLFYAELTSILDLAMTRSSAIKKQKERELSQQELSLKKTIERGPSHGR